MMKSTIAALLLLTLAASAGWRNDTTGERAPVKPTTVLYGGAVVQNADSATVAAAGWREDTPQEIASDAAADQAAVEAQALMATLPAMFNSGVAVLGNDGHWLELVPVGDDVVPVQISNSPLDPATRAAMKAAALAAHGTGKSEWRALNAAWKADNTNELADIDAIRAGLTATSTTSQVRSGLIATARELENLRRDVSALRKMLAAYAREDASE